MQNILLLLSVTASLSSSAKRSNECQICGTELLQKKKNFEFQAAFLRKTAHFKLIERKN